MVIESVAERIAEDRGDVATRARGLHARIRAGGEAAEHERRIPDASLVALRDAGLLRLAVPRRFGGAEFPVSTLLESSAIVAEADGATGWVLSLAGVSDWIVGLFPDRAQREVFDDDPDVIVCGVVAPTATAVRVPGGMRVSGRWSWASGSLHASWALLGVPVVDDAGVQVDQGLALLPLTELRVEDTWFVTGMRGTGSNTLIADDVFLPDHRVLSVSRAIAGEYPTEHHEEALYRAPFVPVLAAVLAAPILGIARAALAEVLDSLAAGKGISYTFYEHAVDSGSTQSAVADAASRIDSAALHLARAGADIDASAADDAAMDAVRRARVRMDVGAVAQYCREAVDLLMSVQGAGAFAESSPLQRMWRDLNIATRHAIVNPLVAGEVYGRALLGVKEQVTPLV